MKTILVTGGSRGIGKAVAKRFSAAGYRVIAPTRSELDLSNRASIDLFLDSNKDLQVDVLVNNAGENKIAPALDYDLESWLRVHDVNLNSAFILSRFFARGMANRGYGRIVNIASLFSFLTKPGRVAYTSSKSGLLGLTRGLAVELAAQNVLVNAVSPGFVATDMTFQNNNPQQVQDIIARIPLSRMVNVEELAEVVFFMGSEANGAITGQNIVVDGGFSIL